MSPVANTVPVGSSAVICRVVVAPTVLTVGTKDTEMKLTCALITGTKFKILKFDHSNLKRSFLPSQIIIKVTKSIKRLLEFWNLRTLFRVLSLSF